VQNAKRTHHIIKRSVQNAIGGTNMSHFYLIGWKEYQRKKIINRGEIIKEESGKAAIAKMMEFNKKRTTTTIDYVSYPIMDILEKAGLELKELINNEKTRSIEKVHEDGS